MNLLPSSPGLTQWIIGAAIELIGFKMILAPDVPLKTIMARKGFLLGVGVVVLGLVIALKGRV